MPSRIQIIVFLLIFPLFTAVSEEKSVTYTLESINCSKGTFKPNLPNTLEGYRLLGNRYKEVIQAAGDYTGDSRTHTSANFWYDGMLLSVVFDNRKQKEFFIETATFTHSRWNRITPIKVGSKIQTFLSKHNLPSISEESTNVRLCSCSEDEGAPDCIDLSIQNGTIMKVKYECYTG